MGGAQKTRTRAYLNSLSGFVMGHLEKPVSLAFRGALRDLFIGGRVNHQRLTLQLIMSLPPTPHPVNIFRCAHYLVLILILLVLVADRSYAADTIKIPVHNWASQIVGAHIVGKILKKAGYQIAYVPADGQVVYTAMCAGEVHLVHEVWEGAFGVAFEKVVKAGCVIDAATHTAKAREEWWYPRYVERLCPGLPDWKALNRCAQLFATPETKPKGRYLAGPADWLKHDHEKVAGLKMDFEVVNAGTAAVLWAELKSASQRNAPIVLFNWTPNFIEAIYNGKFIEFPAYDEPCHKVPGWGINKLKTYDCGNPKDGYLKIGVYKGFPQSHPGAYNIVRQIDFTNRDIATMAKLTEPDFEGLEPEDAADKWLADNVSRWRSWMH